MARTNVHKPARMDFQGEIHSSEWKEYAKRFGRYSGVRWTANQEHRRNRRDRSFLVDCDNYTGPGRTGRHNAIWYCM